MSKYNVNVDNLVGQSSHLYNYKGLRAVQQRAVLLPTEVMCANIVDALDGVKGSVLYIGANGVGNTIHILSGSQHSVMFNVSPELMRQISRSGGVLRTKIKPCDIIQYCAVKPEHRAYAAICDDVFNLLLKLEIKLHTVTLLKKMGKL